MSEPVRQHPLARHVDEPQVRAAIDEAEANTTGKIEVVLASHFKGDIRHGAHFAFDKNLGKLPERNGILFFVVPSRREFVVWGDAAIHEKVGQDFWDHVVHTVRERFKFGDLTGGLLQGIHEAGVALARHFPT